MTLYTLDLEYINTWYKEYVNGIRLRMNIKEFVAQKNWVTRVKNTSYSKRKLIENTIILQTPFLPQDSTLQQRGWHITNEVNSVPKCPVCSNPLKFQKTGNYSKYCSYSCVANSEETKQKKKKTIIEKYGSEEVYKEIKLKKFKQTSLDRFGVDNPFASEDIKEKIKQIKKNPLN